MRLARLSLIASALVAAGCAVSPPDNTYAFRPGNGIAVMDGFCQR